MTETLKLLTDLLKKFEGCKLKAYKCPAGIWTIGYGSTRGVKEGDVITQEQADALLLEEAQEYLDEALRLSPRLRSATPGQQAAIASFVYNCGANNYKSSSLKKNIDAGDFSTARRLSIHLWNKATDPKTGKKVILKGLVKRRQAEADLM